MILRKPYAFLIKHFQKINMLLLILSIFIYSDVSKFSKFAKNYVNYGLYNPKVDAISNYFNSYIVLAFLMIFISCIILIILLKRKDKPILSYILMLVANLYSFGILIYANNYFTYKALKGFRLVTARTISDLSFIATLPYYIIFIILVIRALGIDLKSFGFQDDKELFDVEEADREEVEVEVKFDKEKWIRKVKYYFRTTKYFVLEHLIPIAAISTIVLFVGVRNIYNYIFIDNKIYGMNETVTSNYYKLKVKHTYLTDKDYAGNVVVDDGSYFILVDLEVNNSVGYSRTFNINKMLLFIDEDFYAPATRYNSHFKDMGNVYKGEDIEPNTTTSYLLVYKVPKPKDNANFILKYQDYTYGKSAKLIQIKMKVLNISEFKDKGLFKYKEDVSIPINENDNMQFTINNYEINKTTSYIYQSCGMDGRCPIYQTTYDAPSGKNVMHIKFVLEDKEKEDFIDFINSYAKVRYEINGEEKLVKIKHAITRKYQGNHLYLIVPEEIKNASKVDLLFTIRTYRYFYRLKGE